MRSPVVRTALLVTPAIALVALLAMASAGGGAPRRGDEAPAFSGPLLSGDGDLALQDLSGTPVLLNFWASWCKPCEDEAPILAAAHDRYGHEVAFVGINIRDAISDARAFAREWDMSWPSVRDEDNSIYESYGLTGQPESFFIDRAGIVVEHVPGPLFEDDLLRLLDILLARRG